MARSYERDQVPARRSAIRSKKPPQPCPARSYSSGDIAAALLEEHLCAPVAEVAENDGDELVDVPFGLVRDVNTSRSGSTTSRYSPFQWSSAAPGPATSWPPRAAG